MPKVSKLDFWVWQAEVKLLYVNSTGRNPLHPRELTSDDRLMAVLMESAQVGQEKAPQLGLEWPMRMCRGFLPEVLGDGAPLGSGAHWEALGQWG